MAKKVLITGITGFAGSYLAEYLAAHTDNTIVGTYLVEGNASVFQHEKKIALVKADLTQKEDVYNLIKEQTPDEIYHLAALTSPAESLKHPEKTFTNNISCQINLLEAVRSYCPQTKILLISSAETYGMVDPKDIPIDEETPFRPTNPYAVSKIAQDYLGLQYFLTYKLNIIRVRPFNHIGPRQSPVFVVASFAKKIVDIEKRKGEPILKVGNLEPKRDFTDVRDMVRAYALVMEKGTVGQVYNIGSGIGRKISDMLHLLLSYSSIKVHIVEDPTLLRPSDTPELICDNRKFKQATGWETSIPFEQTLKETLDYWRNIV